ncbi:MAG: DMT family transporter [Paracoccaceae bacterium]|nr:DMT family transporter [Paracoccaceae bacterium]
MMRGVMLMMSAVTLFVVMQAFIKAAGRVPAGQAVFFRSFFALPVILMWLWIRHDMRDGLKTKNWKGHALRGICGTTAMGLGFYGLKFLPLPETTAIRFVTPILIVIFAAVLLGETFRKVRLAAVLLGLCGVLIIMWPRLTFDLGDMAMIGVIVTLGSSALAALAQIFVKAMAGRERTAAIVFYFSLTASTLGLMTAPFGWVMPIGVEWAYLIGAGLIGGVGQILLTSSYRFADASTLAPFTYVSMLWALIIGYFWFAEVPTLTMLFGAGLIIVAGVIIVLRERALGREETAERKLMAQGK